jgi:hypothetical protein
MLIIVYVCNVSTTRRATLPICVFVQSSISLARRKIKTEAKVEVVAVLLMGITGDK